jgi:hypothetical protein
MEFANSTKRRGLQARIAWYNRPKDVVNRKVYDPCLLIATMHSDLNPVSSIRGKCRVLHKDYIDKNELEKYRSQPDSFYYNQLYDRYIQRVYDVVPCESVQNVPKDIQEALMDHYQFIVVEQGKAAELTDTRRVCCVCHGWCARYDCQPVFHPYLTARSPCFNTLNVYHLLPIKIHPQCRLSQMLIMPEQLSHDVCKPTSCT